MSPSDRSARLARTLLPAGLLLALLAGCVDRRFVISTDPPGAIVQVNGRTVGAAPVDLEFLHYGTYRIRIIRDGYETLVIDQPVPAPWYEYFPLDFFSENVVPWYTRDIRRFHYKMEPLMMAPPEAVFDRAEQLRSRGKTIGEPEPGEAPPPGVPVPDPGAIGPPPGAPLIPPPVLPGQTVPGPG